MTATTTAPPTRPWDTVTCVTALCSGCGASAGDEDEGYTPHFTTEEQARRHLTRDYGWRITTAPAGNGDQLLCTTCAARQDCARLGHQPRTAPRTLMADGRVLGESSWCDRCGHLLSHEPATPAPPGYPAPQPARQDLYWDATALPAGRDLAGAVARLLARLSDAAIAARWDAWDGDQAGRPAPVAAPGLAADKAAALALIQAAHQLLAQATTGPLESARQDLDTAHSPGSRNAS